MADQTVDLMNQPGRRSEGRLFGKYRGVVKDNKDPESLGRLQVTVPAVPGLATNWALPCAPYAGKQVGFYAIPPVSAKVWVEFEGGDPSHPIWSGGFWQKDEVPTEVGDNQDDPSQVKVFKTRVATLWINDTDEKGKITLRFKDDTASEPVTVTLEIDSSLNVRLTCQGQSATSKITQTSEDIETDSTNLTTKTSKDTTLQAQGKMAASSDGDMSFSTKAKYDASATGNMSLSTQAELSASATSNATVSSKASLSLSGTDATLSGKSSVSVSSTGTLTASGTTSTTVSSTGSTKVSGTTSLSLGGASISFAPA